MNFQVAFSSSDGLLRKAKGLGLLENYALIGGFAVAVHGVPRATEDIDFAVDLREQDCAGLAEFLKAQSISSEPSHSQDSWAKMHRGVGGPGAVGFSTHADN